MPAAVTCRAVETTEAAPAKINLALHITGQRAGGYHLLETLVTFIEAGDVIDIRNAAADTFSISGPFAAALRASENLVTRARDLLRIALADAGISCAPVTIHLEKNLPVASGIGGGSADAAAALRGLLRHWNAHLDENALSNIALQLGADVPMCLASCTLIARGIGADIEPMTSLPQLFLVLANPIKAVSTSEIFRQLKTKTNPPLPELSAGGWISFLTDTRNDLEPLAKAFLPEIGAISGLLSQAGATLVRMSGSGATCFGLFDSCDAAKKAETWLRTTRPEWYFQATHTI